MAAVPELSPAVSEALAAGRPVVALESTIISHGLPRPQNLDAARSFEAALTAAGAVPATIAVIDGVPKAGLTAAELERIALDESVIKVSGRELGFAMAANRTAGTTVAATSLLAARAGIRVFATGGLGGVHRGYTETLDESADLVALAGTPVTVVSAGVKSVLDIAATLERLETLGVAVAGYRTNRFPAFYLTDSGHDLDWRLDSPAEVAAVMAARDRLGDRSALLIANPLPEERQLDPELHDRVLGEALTAAADAGVRGKAVTPFLLGHMQRSTAGLSVTVNLDVARGNIALAAEIAAAWSARLVAGSGPEAAAPLPGDGPGQAPAPPAPPVTG
jgi:pseudouridylate synthase